MSIIYEALKKMQGSPKGLNQITIPPALPKKPGGRPDKPSFRKQASLAFAGIALGILLAWMIMDKLTASFWQKSIQSSQIHGPLEDKKKQILSPSATDIAPSNTADEETSRLQMPHLLLNGIVLSDEGNLALINDQIVKAGDEIEGAKIEEITNKQVVLSFKNQKIALKNK